MAADEGERRPPAGYYAVPPQTAAMRRARASTAGAGR